MGEAFQLLVSFVKRKKKYGSSIILHFLLMNLDVVTRVFKVLLRPFQNIKKIEKILKTFVRNCIFVRKSEKISKNVKSDE